MAPTKRDASRSFAGIPQGDAETGVKPFAVQFSHNSSPGHAKHAIHDTIHPDRTCRRLLQQSVGSAPMFHPVDAYRRALGRTIALPADRHPPVIPTEGAVTDGVH